MAERWRSGWGWGGRWGEALLWAGRAPQGFKS